MNKIYIRVFVMLMVTMFAELTYGTNLSKDTNSLFFVSGSPLKEGFYSFETNFSVVLYSMTKSDELKRDRVITTWKQHANFIRPYYDEGLLLGWL